nr:hypothetical protein [Bacteroidota bacterium]
MRQATITLLIFILATSVAGKLMAQVSVSGNTESQERLNTFVKHKMEPPRNLKSIDDYCIPAAFCENGDGFEDFIFAGIENLATGCSPDGYGDFTNMQGTAEIGMSYTAGFKSAFNGLMVSMWIDFNDDEEFSEIERILTNFEITSYWVIVETEIEIPGGANTGIHRLRIGANYYQPSSPDPCAVSNYGEWEDYMIEITGNPTYYNAGIVSIDMAPVILAGDVVPIVTIGNFGIETASFPVTLTEPTLGYSSTIEVVDLGYGQILQLEFDTWNISAGVYTFEVCTYLTGDEVPEDDCATHSFACTEQPRQKVVAEIYTGTW